MAAPAKTKDYDKDTRSVADVDVEQHPEKWNPPRASTTERKDVDVEHLKGELYAGEVGYLPLDEVGQPTGPARSVPPVEMQAGGQPFAPVRAVPPRNVDELVTLSGAPVTNLMNPAPNWTDEGMIARNPMPEAGPAPKVVEKTIPLDASPGQPVVNEPVVPPASGVAAPSSPTTASKAEDKKK